MREGERGRERGREGGRERERERERGREGERERVSMIKIVRVRVVLQFRKNKAVCENLFLDCDKIMCRIAIKL